MNTLRPLLIALQFLTRLPVSLSRAPQAEELGRSLLYYPAVGLLIGLLLAGLARVLPDHAGLLPAALVLCAWVLVTGALHLDGLADSADAWVGGLGDKQRTLAIMKDPHCGPMGVVGIVLVLLVKFAALGQVVSHHDELALLIAPTLGRTAPLLLFLTTPYVRPGGIGQALAQACPRTAALATVLLLSFTILFVAGARGLAGILLAGLLFLVIRRSMLQRIGGATGDLAGALIELTECAVLMGLLLI